MVSKLTIVFLTWRNSSIFQRGGGGVKNPAPPVADALSAHPAFDFKSEKEK